MCIMYLIAFLAEYPIIWVYHVIFIYSSVYQYLGCFPLLAMMNNATVSIRVQVYV